MVGDLVDKGVGAVGDRDPFFGGGLDIDRVDADAAERNDLAAIQAVDHSLGDPPSLGVKRVGVARGGDKLVLGPRAHLENLGVDRRQRLHLVSVIAGGGKAGAGRRRDPELGQVSLRLHELDPDLNVAGAGCQSPTVADVAGCDTGINDRISVITNRRESPAVTPTRRSKPGLIESGGPWLWTMLITNANSACVPT